MTADLIGTNLANKEAMKADLTERDPTGYPLQVNAGEALSVAITQIVGKKTYLNDTFIVSDNSHPNSIIYNANQAFKIDDMDTHTNWSSVGAVTVTIAADSTAGHYWVGSNGTKGTWSSTGTCTIRSTQSYGDFQNAVGVTSGTPSQGTAGLWIYTTTASAISGVKLKLGSSSTDWKQYAVSFYSDLTGFTDATLTLQLFDLDNPAATSGTVDWTAIDFVEIEWTANSASNATFDYLNISKNNSISLCGIGDRRATTTTFTQTTGN